MSTRPITDTLRHIGGGVFIDTASDKLAELVGAVDQSGKAGRIDLTISVKKATRGGAIQRAHRRPSSRHYFRRQPYHDR